MTLGIFFTMFIAWTIGTLGVMQFYMYVKGRKSIAAVFLMPVLFFSIFWLIMGIVWFLVGITNFFTWAGHIQSARFLVYVFQSLVGIGILVAWKYFLVRFFPSPHPHLLFQRFLLYAVAFMVMVFEWTLMRYGLEEVPPSFFARQFIINLNAQIVFVILVVPTVVLTLMDWGRVLIAESILKAERISVSLTSASFLLLVIGGSLEQLGLVSSLFVPSSRLLTLLASMAAYITMTYIVGTKKDVPRSIKL
ncbi:MAG: hypothetical protein A3C80_04495 [Candidatus Ryanbacteria bacterium RIFCSPHIGHO2_02_FULL_45_43]|uniref:Uncharacterized protein n=1 Tax=Candidatus Ryanbacteria bacterium RIFCSPHIGHO2_01_45_13 TaxID=1802112 RepID=A0A1G2G1F2_9BACT|nr:MAG: hypothetical protein A2718_04395 [Candidatus Ryanbacteria bacterium RIFCSPHIGHO2_01_FULL_44_130]OGZ43651.1 MAG: hypothetical protein A2W41_04885 [Candidatus Ryanbacteria bacterium RIFCSPHIGHO2_01_45_13]OGZ49134.1 MAG: hypothetical protein A3C80_04495 [Candidatus Ryanbacteria bacterium RIFCSPHIGHO2_02_FULL_45_43]OGZ50915.1 MAG: hypothetical protein A3E55_00565 [Candidatus Ryanbacteria bacterium RIFCSPHIGHO2_12_FULL_44_20]OGZ51394.1 MAG: hypothetical protein A3A17_00195 [Candidatus Ryanba